MRGIKRVINLVITSFMIIGLTGCSEKIFVEEELKNKLEYDKRISDMLIKSSEVFPKDSNKKVAEVLKESENIFDESIKEIRSDLESVFKKSKESENLKLRDSLKKELKELETAYKDLLQNYYTIGPFVNFFNLKFITDDHKKAIKPLYEESKYYIEQLSIEYIKEVDSKEVLEVAATALVLEKEMIEYEMINKYYGLKVDSDYKNMYDLKLPEFKERIDKGYTLDNSKINYLDVKSQSEREPIWEKVKSEINTELKSSGKVVFPSSVMSQDVIIKKSGSIYIVKSYVDIEKDGSKERKEFIVKYDVNRDYYMLISLKL